jgi:hypothetical protein
LVSLQPRFESLAATVVTEPEAKTLIERGALTASRGGRRGDWDGLLAWCDPDTGCAARFALRLVRALPGMHANLRHLHASTSTATGRARALLLARACLDPRLGPAVFSAAVGDHSWRKLYDEADDLPRVPAWRDGPTVVVPDLLRATGRAGARGRPPAAATTPLRERRSADDVENEPLSTTRRCARCSAHRCEQRGAAGSTARWLTVAERDELVQADLASGLQRLA